MKFLSQIFGNKKVVSNEFDTAKQFQPIAETFLFALNIVGWDGPTWAVKEGDFMGGYLQGYADVLAQAHGKEPGSIFGQNIFIQFSNFLLKDGPPFLPNTFIEYHLDAQNESIESGLACGSEDANAFIKRTSTLPLALGKHLGIPD